MFFWGWLKYGPVNDIMYITTAAKAVILGGSSFFITSLLIWGKRWIDKGGLRETETRGAKCSIGVLPGWQQWDRSKKKVKVDADRWPRVALWHRGAPKEYAEAFQAILDTLGYRPDFPASPVTGGHGGQTLLNHTLNVIETGLEMMDQWVFQRRPSDPLAGGSLSKDDRDLVVLILAGHDIGKLDAFRVEDGKVVERKRSHDREGSRILASMNEVWAIPEDDRKSLIAVVAHEHHPQDFPTHEDDRTRLLLEFLIDADTEASKREEGKSGLQTGADQEGQDHQDQPPTQAAQDVFGDDESIWLWFMDFLSKPGSINGRDKRFRVGFKGHDDLIYLNEVSIRRAMAKEFYQDSTMAENRKGDGRYVITENLMRILEDRKVLVQEWDGKRFSYKNALFRISSRDKNGRVLGQWSAGLVVNLGENMPESLRAMNPAPNPPKIDEPVFAQRALKTPRDQAAKQQETQETLDQEIHEIQPIEEESWEEISVEEPEPEQETGQETAQETHQDKQDETVDTRIPSGSHEDAFDEYQEDTPEFAPDLTSFDYGTEALEEASEKLNNINKSRNKGKRRPRPISDRAREYQATLAGNVSPKREDWVPESASNTNANAVRATASKNSESKPGHPLSLKPSLHCKNDCGLLARAIIAGVLKKNAKNNIGQAEGIKNLEYGEHGTLSFSSKEVIELSALGGLDVSQNLDAFLAAIGDNPKVLGGLTFVRNEQGLVEQVIINVVKVNNDST